MGAISNFFKFCSFLVIFQCYALVTDSAQTVLPYNKGFMPNGHYVKHWLDTINKINLGKKSDRTMYLNQGVEFVFPLGVHYILANVNEQLWSVPTTGFETVMEFPKNKFAIMFSSMVNTLKLANFTAYSTIYTKEGHIRKTVGLRILDTDIKTLALSKNYSQSWEEINKDMYHQTNRKIDQFVPKGGFYGKAIYPFTEAVFMNTLQYKNQWATPWKNVGNSTFSDDENVPYLEREGVMPFYENDIFTAVAVLFKGGTGSVVFLKPKPTVSILQLMLNPNALTEIFDESFPGWSIKPMKVRVPEAYFTTNTQHYDTLIKRGVTDTFCNYDFTKNKRGANAYFLNPIVQTNHIQVDSEFFEMVSATGATLNSEQEFEKWSVDHQERERERERDEPAAVNDAPQQEIGTTQISVDENDEIVNVETLGLDSSELKLDDEVTTEQPGSNAERNDLSQASFGHSIITEKQVKKGGKEEYAFNQPFLWFLHATNEEPMFMGIIESFARYKKETTKPSSSNPSWIGDPTKAILWNCP